MNRHLYQSRIAPSYAERMLRLKRRNLFAKVTSAVVTVAQVILVVVVLFGIFHYIVNIMLDGSIEFKPETPTRQRSVVDMYNCSHRNGGVSCDVTAKIFEYNQKENQDAE